ncbi:MAG: esterase-like activity of phytase family protein [Methylococcales bacterium]|nr:esterase-like activity of phytase family protein [Methylococcales bacterium]
MKNKILPFLLPLAIATPLAQASVDLIAIGQIDASYQDNSVRTAGALENGIAGNLLGGMGSGLAYAGGNVFIAVPDRGPNATAYNTLVDDTTSYIPRFHTMNMALAANPSYNAGTVGSLPYVLSPQVTATTLLCSAQALSYGTGASVNLGNGAPALNTATVKYYTGRSDNFNASLTSTNPSHARLDPEGVRVSNNGKYIFISDEYGPYVYQFLRSNGRLVKAFTLPTSLSVSNLQAQGNSEISGNTSGRTANKGMEGLAITPDGTTLVGIMQANLIQDTNKYLRIVTIDIASGATHQYAYKLDDGSGVSEILAINNSEFLVDERDGKGLGDGTSAAIKKLYKINLTGATEISTTSIGAGTPLVTKTATPFLNIVTKLTATSVGITAPLIPAKIEGIAFGPDITVGGVTKHTLFVANDNDFLASVTASGAPTANPNKWFVFSFDDADLPNYVPQTIAPFPLDINDRG